MTPSFFCNLPFTAIHYDGVNASPCCVFKSQSFIPLKGYLQNEEIKTVKEQMLKGVASKQCSKCYDNESKGIPSFRQQTKFHPERDNLILQSNDPNYFDLKQASFVTSNRCNLKCHPCEHSSYIRSTELHRLGYLQIKPKKTTHTNWETLFNYDIEWLTLTGGEPFMDTVTFDLIDQLIVSGKAKNMRLDLNTNMTVITDHQIEILTKNFKEIHIKASIDGIGKVNEYLRYPSKWNKILNNFKKLKGIHNLHVSVTTALSNLSLLKYHEVIRWAHKEHYDLFISSVSTPSVMHASLLPKNIKKELLNIYQSLKDEIYNEMLDRSQECLDRCIEICSTDSNPELPPFAETIQFFKKHDAARPGQSLEKTFPELEFYLLSNK